MAVYYPREVRAALDAIKAIPIFKPAYALALIKTLDDRINATGDTTASEGAGWENNTVEALARAADTIEFPDNPQRIERLKAAQGPDWPSFNLWG